MVVLMSILYVSAIAYLFRVRVNERSATQPVVKSTR